MIDHKDDHMKHELLVFLQDIQQDKVDLDWDILFNDEDSFETLDQGIQDFMEHLVLMSEIDKAQLELWTGKLFCIRQFLQIFLMQDQYADFIATGNQLIPLIKDILATIPFDQQIEKNWSDYAASEIALEQDKDLTFGQLRATAPVLALFALEDIMLADKEIVED